MDDIPYDFEINAEVVVDRHITHPSDPAPGYLRSAGSCRFVEPLHGLTDDLEIANYRVLDHPGLDEAVAPAARVLQDTRERVTHLTEVDTRI